jgi:hypothetical protein
MSSPIATMLIFSPCARHQITGEILKDAWPNLSPDPTHMFLIYHRSVEEVAKNQPYPFHNLKRLLDWGKIFRHDLTIMVVRRVPMPVKAEECYLRDYCIDHFEYQSCKQINIDRAYRWRPLQAMNLPSRSCIQVSHPFFAS